MAGLFTAIGAVGEILSTLGKVKEDPGSAAKEFDSMSKKLKLISTDGSITKFLSKFIVEPVIIISKDARQTDVADKLSIINTDIFASFYSQAFYALADLHGFVPMMAIDILGTDTANMPAVIGGKILDKGLPKAMEFAIDRSSHVDYFGDLINSNSKYLSFSNEAMNSRYDFNKLLQLDGIDPDEFWELYGRCDNDQKEYMDRLIDSMIGASESYLKSRINTSDVDKARKEARSNRSGRGLPSDEFARYAGMLTNNYNYDEWKEAKYKKPNAKAPKIPEADIFTKKVLNYVNNKVGALQAENLYYINHRDLRLTLSLKDSNGSEKQIIIPIIIKTHVIATSIDNILNMLKPNDKTKKFGYRFDEWRSGAISLRELIFCGDLIQSYKKNKLKDKDGLLDIVKKREESANAKLMTAEMVGFEKFYNMLIVTAEEKVLLNKHIGGDILNEKYKQELLTEAHALTLSVVDQDYERVYILTKDIRGKSDVTFKSINKVNNKNSDLESIVKALMSNRPPVF